METNAFELLVGPDIDFWKNNIFNSPDKKMSPTRKSGNVKSHANYITYFGCFPLLYW